MNKNLLYVCGVALAILYACGNKKTEYQKSDAGFEYLYRVESNSGKFPHDSTMLFLQIRLFNDRDSVLFDSRDVAPQFKDFFAEPIPTDQPLHRAYAMMQEGDSMSFLFNARDYYRQINPHTTFVDSFAEHEKLRFEIKLEKIFTEEEILTSMAKQLADKKLEEEFLVADYIEHNYPAAKPSVSGLYFIQERAGSGASPTAKNTVVLHYKVTYINGEPLYSTYTKNDPLVFQVSDPNVFPCLAEAVQRMKQGSRAIIVAPSKIAAGEKGNSQQRIAPYTPLIFDMELVNILK
ncbi:MAG: FKBP-type peptidyl-prolyl cis-trans isomerase [Bacteroidales bacterium]|jgi:FKBP-type peptidyl-prolyl cis-trans isomerase|nr:FKBP-type peptidyl-prolyl cis-trans isomerase [Bacteroidales bacterium]